MKLLLGTCFAVPLLGALVGGLTAAAQPCTNGSAVPYLAGAVACSAVGIWWSLRHASGLLAAAAAVGTVILTTGALLVAAFAVGFDRCFVF